MLGRRLGGNAWTSILGARPTLDAPVLEPSPCSCSTRSCDNWKTTSAQTSGAGLGRAAAPSKLERPQLQQDCPEDADAGAPENPNQASKASLGLANDRRPSGGRRRASRIRLGSAHRYRKPTNRPDPDRCRCAVGLVRATAIGDDGRRRRPTVVEPGPSLLEALGASDVGVPIAVLASCSDAADKSGRTVACVVGSWRSPSVRTRQRA